MTSARDFGRATKPGGDLWHLRRKPGGDVWQYRQNLRTQARAALVKWRASGYRDRAAYAEAMDARAARQESIDADNAALTRR